MKLRDAGTIINGTVKIHGQEYLVLQVKYEEGKEDVLLFKKPMPWFTSLMRQKNDGEYILTEEETFRNPKKKLSIKMQIKNSGNR
jgi:hypothetical protein